MRTVAAVMFALLAFVSRGEWVSVVVTNSLTCDGVEYLENSVGGTQFISTEHPLDQFPFVIDATIEWLYDPTVIGENNFFGNYKTYGNEPNTIMLGAKGSYWYCYAYGDWHPGSPSSGVVYRVKYEVSNLYMRLNVNGIQYSRAGSSVSLEGSGLSIFTGGGSRIYRSTYGRVYRAAFFVGGIQTYDFVPVLHDGQGKMLDLLSGKFYSNAGTGEFRCGAVTGNVKYVSIKTNYVYRAPAPIRTFDAQHPFNNADARTRLGGTGKGEDGTTLRPTAHFDIKRNEED